MDKYERRHTRLLRILEEANCQDPFPGLLLIAVQESDKGIEIVDGGWGIEPRALISVLEELLAHYSHYRGPEDHRILLDLAMNNSPETLAFRCRIHALPTDPLELGMGLCDLIKVSAESYRRQDKATSPDEYHRRILMGMALEQENSTLIREPEEGTP